MFVYDPDFTPIVPFEFKLTQNILVGITAGLSLSIIFGVIFYATYDGLYPKLS